MTPTSSFHRRRYSSLYNTVLLWCKNKLYKRLRRSAHSRNNNNSRIKLLLCIHHQTLAAKVECSSNRNVLVFCVVNVMLCNMRATSFWYDATSMIHLSLSYDNYRYEMSTLSYVVWTPCRYFVFQSTHYF